MTALENQNELREALARGINPYAFHHSTPDNFGPDLEMAYFGALQRIALKTADALIAGPLASLIAERDADRASLRAAEAEITRLRTERDAMAAKLAKATETYTDPKGAVWDPVPAWLHFAVCQASRANRAEITRLKEGMEARDAALRPFAAGGPWGGWLSWLINGAPDREQGKAAAKQIVHWRAAVDIVLSPKEHPHG